MPQRCWRCRRTWLVPSTPGDIAFGPLLPRQRRPSPRDARIKSSIVFASAVAIGSLSSHPITRAEPNPVSDALKYSVLLLGHHIGSMSVARRGDTLTAHYEYEERGHGPSLDERVVLDAARAPREIDISGKDRWGNRVHDRLTVENGNASWDNSAEQGRAPAGPLYLPFEATPVDYAVIASALGDAPGGRAKLLPSGEVALRPLERREIAAGLHHATVQLFALDGLSLHPLYVWLDEDRRLFFAQDAVYSPAAIREGFEGELPSLMKAQTEADDRWQGDLARRLSRPLSRPLAIRHARLFAAEEATSRPGSTVVVDGDRIGAVGSDASVTVPAGAEVVDAAGRTLIPGLWDMHQHLSGEYGILDLAAGVTTARDLANERHALRRLVDGYANGTLLGPRVIRAGLIDGPGPFAIPAGVTVSTPEEAERAVDDYAAEGYAAIKIYGSLSPSLVPVIARRAHAKGLRVGGHIPAQMTAAQAVRDGYDEINHVVFLILNFFGPTESANISTLTASFAEHASLVDPTSGAVREFISLLKEHRTLIDPTLDAFEMLLLARKGTPWPGYETVADRLPAQARRRVLNGGVPVSPGMEARYREAMPACGRLVKALYDAGVPIVAGTDFGIPGFALQRELELYVAAGIPPAQVLQLATLGAARAMGRESELGSITPGKLADLVLVDGDPTVHISDVRRPTLVVTRGRAYDPEKLVVALGIRPQ